MTDKKITAEHLRRTAYLYIRQSSMRQVIENRESTQRQYALKNRALALGWKKDQIVVIDDDLGISGTSSEQRKGFQKLVAEVGLGYVGIVMGLEVSRLARNNMDWHRLLEICALSDTLILDEDGLYDPCCFNDRLLLGLKGTMSEAEIHFIKARMEGGRLNKAKRGELKVSLPVGLVYNDAGKVILDDDRQVRESVEHLFSTFQRTGSAYAVVKHFRKKGLKFPTHARKGPNAGEILWKPLYHNRVVHALHNPRYAGAFVFGRTKCRKNPTNGKTKIQKISQDQWKVIIPDAHEGYISWVQYQQNQKQLASNAIAQGQDHRRPPRSGPALLQGILLCGRCGHRMSVHYHSRSDTLIPEYICQQLKNQYAGRYCQFVPGEQVDEAVARILLEMVSPTTLEVAMQVFDEIRKRSEEVVQLLRSRLERARHEAELAQRRFLLVNPENRLVADSLERRWNDALNAVTEIEREAARTIAKHTSTLTLEQMMRIRKLAEDFPSVWNDPRTSLKERKRMVRLLIEDVTLFRTNLIYIKIRFRGGTTKELSIPIPLHASERIKTAPETIEHVREMAHTKTDGEIAEELNQQGILTGKGLQFTRSRVNSLRYYYKIPGIYDYLREMGYLTIGEVADRFSISKATVRRWGRAGILKFVRYNDNGTALYEEPMQNDPPKWDRTKIGLSVVKNVHEGRKEVQYEA